MPQPRRERGRLAGAADIGKVILQQSASLQRGMEHPVRPAPGLRIVVLGQISSRCQGFHPVDIRPPRALEQPA